MQSFDFPSSCSECRGPVADLGDELVCQACGVVRPKEVIEGAALGGPQPRQPLGSYLGSADMTPKERNTKGLSSNSTVKYLKMISDFAGRDEGTKYTCEKLIERVSEKLSLPQVVTTQAIAISRKVLELKERRGATVGAVSAYSLIAACKVGGVSSVSIKDVIDMHATLGKRVKSSTLIQLSLVSPIKTRARAPSEYLNRVLAKLTFNGRLLERLQAEGASPSAYRKSLWELSSRILDRADGSLTAGRRPSTLAATAVYAAEVVLARREGRKRRVTQRDLAECGDSAEYTVREQYR
ncbi:MAG TPA: hypothetical protein VEB67_01535, partial [Nitrososphaerales archaeon]|nr:hypothetical protein [Nitrososphaerales archaeon]